MRVFYTVTFKDWDGSVISSQAVEAGITATKPIDPTRTSYAFDGWYKETAYTNRWDFNMGVVTTNITLYAKWKWTPSNDVVTWDGKVDVSWYNSSQMQFIIITAEQLAGLSQLVNNGANNFEGKTITLGNNIELNDTTDWQNWENNAPANSWTAIGSSSSNSFRGTFDGAGFDVSGIYINSSSGYQGLFGCVSGGAIMNLGIIASYVKGTHHVGGLVGANGFFVGSATITNCYAIANVIGTGFSDFVGGLVGANGGIITNSYANGNVTGTYDIGGLVGVNGGIISNSYATGNVSGTRGIGGLIGINTISSSSSSSSQSTITNSYATGNVSGTSGIGGLIGINTISSSSSSSSQSTITNSYATGNVSGTSGGIGGLIGINTISSSSSSSSFQSTITNSYAVGNVSGTDGVGGLIGSNSLTSSFGAFFSSTIIRNCYAAGSVLGISDVGGLIGVIYESPTNSTITITNCYYKSETTETGSYGISKTPLEMRSNTFTNLLNVGAYVLSLNKWDYSEGQYPTLSNTTLTDADFVVAVADFFDDGDGTEDNPYTIKTEKHLENLSHLVNIGVHFEGKHVKLGNNIELNDTTDWQNWENNAPANSWTAIGSSSSNSFRGTFDGAGFDVSGIYINSSSGYQGLFGCVSGGAIMNLGIIASYVKGTHYVGGLVGYNSSGTITNSYATGNVSGISIVGGLVGYNNSYSGTISNSYATGNVIGTDRIGGLIGYSHNTSGRTGIITNSYATGNISGISSVGGLIGDSFNSPNRTGIIANCYYKRETVVVGSNGTPKTMAEMKQQTTYTSWDFANVWAIRTDINDGYPYLRIFKSDYNITFENKIVTYNGEMHSITATNIPSGVGVMYDGNGKTNVGVYTVTANFTTSNINYNTPAPLTATLTINKANPPYTVPADLMATYGQTLADVVLTNGLSWMDDKILVGDVGEQPHLVRFIPENTENYNIITDIEVTVIVGKAILTITADDNNVIYGNVVPDYTVSYHGFMNNETEAVLGGVLEFACDYTTTSNAGTTFDITPSGLTSTNYDITFVKGTLTVDRAPIAVPTAISGLTYNGSSQTGVSNGTGYTLSATYTATNAGNHTATATPTANYQWNSGDNITLPRDINWTIDKKTLSVIAENKSVTYGNPAPSFTVEYSGFIDGETKDDLDGTLAFICGYTTSSNAGTVHDITPNGLTSDNYAITFTRGTLTVERAPIAVPTAISDLVFTNISQTGVLTGTGYTLSGTVTATSAGNYIATATPTANYRWDSGENTTSARSIPWTIERMALTGATVTVGGTYTYTGTAQTPTSGNVSVTLPGYTPTYTAIASNNTNAGNATVTVTGTGNFSGTAEGTFTISPRALTSAAVTVGGTYIYTGDAITPPKENVTVTLSGYNPTYDITASNNINAGTATATITGTGNFTGTLTRNFTIQRKPLTAAMLSIPAVIYNGISRTPVLTVTDGTETLMMSTDYTVTLTPRTNAGTYPVSVTGAGNYTGTSSVNFAINPKLLTEEMLYIPAVVFDGTQKTPVLTVTDHDIGALTRNADFTVTLTPRTDAGTYLVTVTGINNYTGTPSVNFVINPAQSCAHDFSVSVTDIPATCTNNGSGHYKCSLCGAVGASFNIGATGHNFGALTTTTSATCTLNGEQARTCSICGVKTDIAVIDMLGHNLTWAVTTPPTCTHTGVNTGTCTRVSCTHTETDALAINPNNHDWGNWVITLEPTKTSEGVQTRTCKHNVSHTQTEAIPVIPSWTVTVSGGIGGGNYAAGEIVTITADEAPLGKSFILWTTDNDDLFFDIYERTTWFVMPAGDVTVTAVYNSGIVGAASSDRIIPGPQPDVAAVSVSALTSEFTAGPNPVLMSNGKVNFFCQGKPIQSAVLTIFDASGNVINKVQIKDGKNTGDNNSRKIVGSWDFKDVKGRLVSEGTYLVRGVVTTSDGKREQVSVMLGIR